MKIIATDNNGKLILEASDYEIANLANFSSVRSEGFKKDIGTEINVTETYQRYAAFERLIKSKDFEESLEKIKKVVKLLTPIDKLIKETEKMMK